MSQLGRISGPLLKANLLRQGVDLAFETDLLYLDVTNLRVGIKTTSPTHDLQVVGTTKTTNLEVDDQLDIGNNLTFTNNTISTTTGDITITAATGNTVFNNKIIVDKIDIEQNIISTNTTNENLEIRTSGTGQVELYANTLVDGNLHVTGNITADGDIQLGDANTDNITFNADVASNIIPNVNEFYTLGSDPAFGGKRWLDVWANTLYADTINTGIAIIDGIDIGLNQGNIYYVAANGDDTYTGTHQNDPYATIRKALSEAASGDTVYIYPGTYEEIFPLTVPVGVAVKGTGIRSVKIIPTAETNDNDAFLLNGESTVEDLTVADFFSPGYAFKFATNLEVTTRSPYIRNISVLTKGSEITLEDPLGFNSGDAGKGAYIDGSVAVSTSNQASMLFHSVTFITPGVDAISATNGVRIEWLNCFSYYANKGMNLFSSSAGFAGNGKTKIKISARSGTWTVGNTITYYDTDGTTVLASGVIESIDGDTFIIDGKQVGFETPSDRAGKSTVVYGNAQLDTTIKKFGTASLQLDGTGDYISYASQPDFAFPSTARLAKTITANGNAAVSATQSKFGGSSIAFDGTGDYLSIATDTDYGFGTGDFTIEGWFYKTVVATQYLFDTRTTLTENSIAVQSNGGGNLRLFVNGSFVLTSSNAHTNNAWNHLAICRASGVTRFFINGVVSTTTYTDATDYGTTKPLVVGAQYNGTTAFAGYIDDFRVSNTARYTATFTPTTTAFVNNVNTKLLIHGDSTIADDVGGTSTDFTLESWIYRSVSGVQHIILDFRTTLTQDAPVVFITSANILAYFVNGANRITGTTVSTGVWHHVALSRSGTSTKLFFNGTQVGSTYTDTTSYIQSPLTIGSRFDGLSGNFNGYIDEVRVTNGLARYTSNFTAPTAAFTNDTSTVLLLHFNGADGSTVITDDGVGTQDLRTSAGGTASAIDFADYSEFGAEVRSIGSAAVYGNYGIYGDGDGVIAYLIGQNLAYIGNGKETTNDPTTVIQANEVVELNRAKIYYSSVDHNGDFRVGDLFYVNQRTGEVQFSNSNISFSGGITFDDGAGNVTIVDSNKVQTGNIRISGNTIESLINDINFISANDQLNFTNNVNVTGDVDVVGNVTIGGNIQIGDANTDSVNIVAKISSDLIPRLTDTYNLGTALLRWQTLFSTQITTDAIDINDNRIRTINSNSDLELEANGTGRIYVPNNNVLIDQNLTVNTTTSLKNTNVAGTITHTGALLQTGNTTQTGNINLTGQLTVSDVIQFEDIKIDGNVITTTIGNNDLRLEAAGTGRIYVPSNNVVFDQALTVVGTTTTSNINNSDTITSATLRTSDIRINGNRIDTTTSNSNLELRTNGTGFIILEGFDVQENEIRSNNNADITLTPNGIGIVTVNSTQSIQIPVGASGDRPSGANGMIRYNTDLTRYEGYNNGNWLALSGVEDADGNTKITAELTPGADDNTIRFYTDGVVVADLNSTRLNANNIDVDDINISGNTVSTTTSDTNLILAPNGSGSVVIGDFAIRNNTITNTVIDSITTFNQVGGGYFKIAGTNGFVIPVGSDEERPGLLATGLMRYNTTGLRVEIYDGSQWVSVAGSSGGISVVDAEDLSIRNALIFG
jgi:hypothetical protein